MITPVGFAAGGFFNVAGVCCPACMTIAPCTRTLASCTRFFASVVIDPIYEKRKLVGFAKITRDITERQISLSELSKSESQFKTLVEGVTDYALYMLDPTGIVSNWNAGGVRIKG